MIYFICQEWSSTMGNHAGMVHLFKSINEMDEEGTKVIVLPIRKGLFKYIIAWLLTLLKVCILPSKGDSVLFSECLSMGKLDQCHMGNLLKVLRPNIKVFGIVHLIPSLLENIYQKKNYSELLSKFDGIFTLGSSLSEYLINNGCDKQKFFTLFHYVDTSYYHREVEKVCEVKENLTCVVMGNLGRNFELIREIVKGTPQITYYICRGHKHVESLFENCPNANLLGYMEESKLKDVMCLSDISLNVMEDTIGSNVICTSLSMGLAMVCSDVGSIHDYCDAHNAMFCKTSEEFIDAMNRLSENRECVGSMQKHSIELSKKLEIRKFYEELLKIVCIK